MQAHYFEAFRGHNLLHPLPGFRLCACRFLPLFSSTAPRVSCFLPDIDWRPQGRRQRAGKYATVKAKKDNVWSIDNELASKKSAGEKKGLTRRRKMDKVKSVRRRSGDSTVMVSGPMLTEIETVLQTQQEVSFWFLHNLPLGSAKI